MDLRLQCFELKVFLLDCQLIFPLNLLLQKFFHVEDRVNQDLQFIVSAELWLRIKITITNLFGHGIDRVDSIDDSSGIKIIDEGSDQQTEELNDRSDKVNINRVAGDRCLI